MLMSITSIDQKLNDLEESIKKHHQFQFNNINEMKLHCSKIEQIIKDDKKEKPSTLEINKELMQCKANTTLIYDILKNKDISLICRTKIDYFKDSLSNLRKKIDKFKLKD